MSKSNDKQGEAQKEPRCDPKQLDLLKKCSEKRDTTEWNKWRKENRQEQIWLQGANLAGAHLERVNLSRAHLEGANLSGARLEKVWLVDGHLEGALLTDAHLERAILFDVHLERANLIRAHLQEAELPGARLEAVDLSGTHLEKANLYNVDFQGAKAYMAHFEGANFTASIVDGLTLFWYCSVDRKTDFRVVGLNSCRIREKTRYLLEYNRRRMNCEDWYQQHPRLAWPVKAFFWMSDYGNSTWRIIKTFFFMSICFAIVYYIWGAVDYYLVGVTDHPGIVSNLFIDQHGQVLSWLIPLRSIYFSIVTMTTLGFGDMYANAHNYWFAATLGHLLLGLQVLLGYCLLGALITRFAVLFKSGLIPGQFQEKQKEA